MNRGLAYGEACFETFRVIHHEIFAWHEHCQRLASGLAEFGLSISEHDFDMVRDACLKEAATAGEDALVRFTISGGEMEWGLFAGSGESICYIQALPAIEKSAAAVLQLKQWPFPLKAKHAKFTADYAETLRALKGCRNRDILFEQDGVLIAAATSNLLLYRHGTWWTPDGERGVLPGVVRDHLIKVGAVREAVCPVEWLADTEAVAVCSSGMFIRPVAEVEHINSFDIEHPVLRILTEALAGYEGVPEKLL